jgi:hypothetical protein
MYLMTDDKDFTFNFECNVNDYEEDIEIKGKQL